MIPARHTYIIYGWPCRIDSYIANNFRLSLECRIWPLYGIYILVPPIFPPQLLDKCAAVLKLKSKSTLSHCSNVGHRLDSLAICCGFWLTFRFIILICDLAVCSTSFAHSFLFECPQNGKLIMGERWVGCRSKWNRFMSAAIKGVGDQEY